MYYPANGRYGVASRIYLASQVGINILSEGGNVFDAAIAISSVLSVVIPHTGGLGGDAFILARLGNGEIIGYNGSGRSPISFPVDQFISLKPRRGGLTVSVPGLVDTWIWMNNYYGSMDLKDLLKPAISLAVNGFYIPYQTVKASKLLYKELSGFNSWNKVYGSIEYGSKRRFREMGLVLKYIAKWGLDGFYSGEIADKIVTQLNGEGSPLSTEDFERHRGEVIKPLKIDYNGFEVYELPPNTQGLTTLEILRMMESIGLSKGRRDLDWWMKYMEVAALSYMDRDRYIADPDYMDIDPQEIIDKKRIRDRISSLTLSGGDTTFFTLSDKYGNILGFIQSLFHPFGSGLVAMEIPFQNRLIGFNSEMGLPNSPGPGKRPLHTLSIALLSMDDTHYIIGCAGGDLRPQIHSQVISNIVDLKMDIGSAVSARRNMLIKWGDGKPVDAVFEDVKYPSYGRALEYPSRGVGIVQALKYVDKGYTEVYADIRGGGVALAI